MKYSLANYIISFQADDPRLQPYFANFSIGGQGSMLGSITVDYKEDLFTTETFETGGWVHNKNLSKVGTVTLNISQLSVAVAKLKQLCNYFYDVENYEGFTISVDDTAGNNVCVCKDCYPTKIPQQSLQGTAQRQDWAFTSGEVTFA